MSTITMSIEQHDALVRELSAKSAECQRLREALAVMLGAAETDALDDKSNVWRSAMIDARAALQEVQP